MFKKLAEQLKANARTIVFTEGTDARILEAADKLTTEGILGVILLGKADEVKSAAKEAGFNIEKCQIIDPEQYAEIDAMVDEMVTLRKGKMTPEQVRDALSKSNYFGTMLVKMGAPPTAAPRTLSTRSWPTAATSTIWWAQLWRRRWAVCGGGGSHPGCWRVPPQSWRCAAGHRSLPP